MNDAEPGHRRERILASQTEVESGKPDAGDVEARLLALVRALADELHAGSPLRQVALDSHLERDIGLDSLARAELLTRIEAEFGVQLPVEIFASATTPADVLGALRGGTGFKPGKSDNPTPDRGSVSPEKVSALSSAGFPQQAATLIDVLHWHADRHSAQTHVVFIETDGVAESRLSYGELWERARNVASGLRDLGIDPGDTVALMQPTSLDFFVVSAAILLCGAIAVPIYPPAHINQLTEHVERHTAMLASARIKALVTFDEAATVGQLLRARISTIHHVLTLADIPRSSPYTAVLARPDDVALLQYTSGSTGTPKGVMLTHGNLLANIRAMGERIHVVPSDVLVSWLPLYHNMGLIGAWLAPLYFGIPLVITSPLAFLARPETWLRMITRFQGTITAAPNFAYDRCARQLPDSALEGLDLSSLRFSCCGAEPVSVGTMRAFSDRMSKVGFDARALAPVYGLAENALALTLPPAGRGVVVDHILRVPLADDGNAIPALNGDAALDVVGCGYALSGSELRIADDHGQSVPDRHVGRVEFRGLAATKGYYRDPGQTARLMDGAWLDSGDLGYIAEGELHITGRRKDMIIRGGRHFFPYELEESIGRLQGAIPGGVAVCGGMDSARGTERVIIFVETAETDPGTREGLVKNIEAAAIACLGAPAERVVLIVPGTIPRTPAGKIRHAAMLDRFEESERGNHPLQATVARRPAWRQFSLLALGSAMPFLWRIVRRGGIVVYGLWCWIVVLSIAPILWLCVVVSADEARNWRYASRAARLFLFLTGLRMEVAGEAARYPAPAAIVAANHMSYLDSVILLARLPYPLHFVVKRELESTALLGRFLKALGARFVERRDYRASLDDEARLVAAAEKDTLLFFPEGTFGRASGLRPFHLGAFRAACLAGRPVVPIALRGVRMVLRDGDWLPRPGHAEMIVLPPIYPEGSDLHSMVKLRDAVRAAILNHCGESELGGSDVGPHTPKG